MEPDKKDATVVAPSPTEDSAKVTPESLRAAQDSAESARKETATLKTMLEDTQSQNEEFKSTIAEIQKQMERDGKTQKGVQDASALAKTLRAQAAAGDKDAIAVLESAREIAREEYGAASMKERMEASYDQQESFIESKAAEHGITAEKFQLTIDKYAEPYANKLPHVQAQMAYAAWKKEDSLSTREARILEKEKEMGLYRDPGSEGASGDKKPGSQAKNWRDAKTPIEKRAALDDI